MPAPFFTISPRRLAANIACVCSLMLFGQTVAAGEVLVVTDSLHPVQSVPGAGVIELDLPARIEAELAAGLPANSARAAAIVRQRLRAGGDALQRRMAGAYQGVANAWSLGVAKLPAVVVDRRYVVYGEPNVASAVARIARQRGGRP